MCGIFGYVGKKQAAPILLKGLKKLEYRGYDSAGMATIHKNKIEVLKDVGKVDEINSKVNFENLKGNVGIAHTRWATHGKVTKENAHPHVSNNGEIAVVHNGIIENFQEQHDFIAKEGF
jgi:glucosamine--fructose-6-phosphate aminotransferase (isomerizing)